MRNNEQKSIAIVRAKNTLIRMLQNQKGEKQKTALTSSPFVLEFEYGANAEGYWVYEHMVLQLEDCVDCLKVLYPEI